ncbi:MAG TPA: M1 family aminopeptidase, partial [Bryobacteraceae bacterium]|nr:M1 family aminopeptidase [Bryobacteraceae bacterium]
SLRQKLQADGARKAPDIGALMVERWSQIVSNLMTSFESRIVLDLLTPGQKGGFFEAVIRGNKLGNFDVLYDSRGYEQLVAGQITEHNGVTWWDTWTSFPSHSYRGLPPPKPEEEILSYRIDASLDSSLMMRCMTRVHIRATAESRNLLAFDLSGQMRATSVKVDGVPAEAYERDSVRNGLVQNSGNELLLVIPATPLEPGSEHDVEIAHEGRVVREAGHDVYFVSARGTWYPGRGLQFATYDVTYRYPNSFDLVAAGKVTEDRMEGDVHITRRVPAGRVRLLGFNLGKYLRKSIERNGITVEAVANRQVEDALRPRAAEPLPAIPDLARARRRVPPGVSTEADKVTPPPAPSPAGQLTRIAEEVEDAAAFYRGKFGDPPIRHIEVSPVPGRFGQGFAGMIYLPTVNYLIPDSGTGKDQGFFRDLLVAHEVAHQWWGNIVTSGSYHHEWLMEALANYSAVMYMETKIGARASEIALESYRKALFERGPDGETAESEGPVVQGRRLEGSNNPNASSAVMYGKGSWVIHMLRRRMGDEQFLKMLGELRHRYEWKALDTEAFRTLCAEYLPPGSADPKLENFFDQWVYGTGVPTLKLTFSVKGKPGAYRLTGTVTQSDVPDDFSIGVPVEIQKGRGKSVVQQVRTGSDPVAFTVNVSSPTAKAVLDPGWSVLRR